jgi:acyl carrier protein
MIELNNIIRAFILENFLFGDEEDLEENTSFLENGIIDSTGILELVAFIEETFEIIVKDEDLIPENLDSIANVVRYIHENGAYKNDFFKNSFRH